MKYKYSFNINQNVTGSELTNGFLENVEKSES